jgi:hypothetical protein
LISKSNFDFEINLFEGKLFFQLIHFRDANPLQNSGWFGLCVSKICHFGFGFRVFKNPILGLGSGSGFEFFSKKSGFGLGFVKNIKIPTKLP